MPISNTCEKYLFLHSLVLVEGEFRLLREMLHLSIFFFYWLLHLRWNLPRIPTHKNEEGEPMNKATQAIYPFLPRLPILSIITNYYSSPQTSTLGQ